MQMQTANRVQVVCRPKPFSEKIIRDTVAEGTTLLQIVRALRLPSHFQRYGMICINSEPVPVRMWRYVRPKASAVVTLHLRLHGDEVGDIIKLVATIAVVAVATLVSGGALAPFLGAAFASGGVGALLGAAAVSVGGLLAVNALIPPPTTKPTTLGKALTVAGLPISPDSGGVGGSPASLTGNVIAPGASLPRSIGTMRLFPPFLVEPLVDVIDDDQFAEGIIGLAGSHSIEDVKIGDIFADDVPELEYEIATTPTLVTRYGRSIQVGLTVSQHVVTGPDPGDEDVLLDQATPANSVPRFHRLLSRESPDEVWIPLAMSEGVYDGSDTTNPYAFPMRVRLRKLGDSAWINCPEVHFTSRVVKPLIRTLRFMFRDPDAGIPRPNSGGQSFYYANKNVPGQSASPGPATTGWVADSHFSAGAGNDVLNDADFALTNVRNVSLRGDRVEFWLGHLPAGIYEFEIIQGALYRKADFDQSNYKLNGDVTDLFAYHSDGGNFVTEPVWDRHYKISIPSVSSVWNDAPVIGTNITCISLRVRGRQLNDISVLASGLVPIWSSGSWAGSVATSNPAAHFRDVLSGAYNFDPLPSTLLDDDELGVWYEYCADQALECNAVVDGQPVFSVATMIASCGFARPRQCEKWGVMIDRDRRRESVVQLFTFRNLQSFRWEKAFNRRPSGFRVNFINRDLGYKDDEIIVDDPDRTVEDRYEQIRYEGIVDETAAGDRALFDLAQSRLRSTFYYGTANIQNIVARRGDLVGVQHDIIDHVAGSAYIKEVLYDGSPGSLITGFVLDGSIPRVTETEGVAGIAAGGGFGAYGQYAYGEGASYTPGTYVQYTRQGIAIRVNDENGFDRIIALEILINQIDDEVTQVELTEPYDDADGFIRPGLLISTGAISTEYKRLILMTVQPRADLSADLIFVDESPSLWD